MRIVDASVSIGCYGKGIGVSIHAINYAHIWVIHTPSVRSDRGANFTDRKFVNCNPVFYLYQFEHNFDKYVASRDGNV